MRWYNLWSTWSTCNIESVCQCPNDWLMSLIFSSPQTKHVVKRRRKTDDVKLYTCSVRTFCYTASLYACVVIFIMLRTGHSVRACVRPSVCPKHVGTESIQLNESSRNRRSVVAHELEFTVAKDRRESPAGLPQQRRQTAKYAWVGKLCDCWPITRPVSER